MVALYALDSVGRVIWLAKGDIPPRTPAGEGLNLVANIAVLVWMVVLLVRG